MTDSVYLLLNLVYPETLVSQPVLWEMARQFDVAYDVRKAWTAEEGFGIAIVGVRGEEAVVDQAWKWLESQGVDVSLVDTATGGIA